MGGDSQSGGSRQGGQNLTEVELIDFCKAHLASYKKPTSVTFVDSLPKTQFGRKVLKREVRERFSKKK